MTDTAREPETAGSDPDPQRILDLLQQIRQALAALELVSHAPTQSWDPTARDTSEHPGGRRPPGTDRDTPPRNASLDERAAWRDSYHAKTVASFQRRLARITDDQPINVEALGQLRDEIHEVIAAWKRAPIPDGQEPLSRADPNWKRYVAECGRDSGELARRYGVTRRYINRIRQMDWSTRENAA